MSLIGGSSEADAPLRPGRYGLLRAAAHARKLGMLQYEYEHAAAAQEPWYKRRSNTRRYSRSATGLSADYQALADEILCRFVSRLTAGVPG